MAIQKLPSIGMHRPFHRFRRNEVLLDVLKGQTSIVDIYRQQATTLQGIVNTSQATINACVTGSIEKLKEKTQVILTGAKLSTPDPKIAAHFQEMLLMSNQVLPVSFRIHCNKEISSVLAGVVDTTTVVFGGGGRVSAYDWDIKYAAPSMGPSNPLDVTVYYNQPGEPSCTFARI